MSRDRRDPQALGEAYLAMRKEGVSIELATKLTVPDFKSNETCIDRYGRADDVVPTWMEVQVK